MDAIKCQRLVQGWCCTQERQESDAIKPSMKSELFAALLSHRYRVARQITEYRCFSEGCLSQTSHQYINYIYYFSKEMMIYSVSVSLSSSCHCQWLSSCIHKPAQDSPHTRRGTRPERGRSPGSRPAAGPPVLPLGASAEQPAGLRERHGWKGTTKWK